MIHSVQFSKTSIFISSVVISLVFGFACVQSAHAATCTFTRDLEFGVVGEDVKCLQEYLNSSGYEIAATGPGSPGKETGEYKTLTEQAVIKWQKANTISPASGLFGSKSRAMYLVRATNVSATPKPTPVVSNTTVQSVSTNSTTGASALTQKAVLATLDAINEAEDDGDIDDDELNNARENLLVAVRKYFAGSYEESRKLAEKIEKNLDDAKDEDDDEEDDDDDSGDDNNDESDAEDLLDEVEENLDDAWDEVEQADEDGEKTSKSEDLL